MNAWSENNLEPRRFHEMFGRAVVVHNMVEMLRASNEYLSRHPAGQVREFLRCGNIDAITWLEPFSVELWLKAILKWVTAPDDPLGTPDKKSDKKHNLSALWQRVPQTTTRVIENEYEHGKKLVSLRGDFQTMKSSFPSFRWTEEDMDLITLPQVAQICSHYKTAFTDYRYRPVFKVPAFAASKETAIKERGFQIGIRVMRSAMRAALFKGALTDEENRRLVIDPLGPPLAALEPSAQQDHQK